MIWPRLLPCHLQAELKTSLGVKACLGADYVVGKNRADLRGGLTPFPLRMDERNCRNLSVQDCVFGAVGNFRHRGP